MAAETILSINCGSSSLKFALYDRGSLRSPSKTLPAPAASGSVAEIGPHARCELRTPGGRWEEPRRLADHGQAARWVLDRLIAELPNEMEALVSVGHRIVHGGPRFSGPAILDETALVEIERGARLAPLHNRPALEALAVLRERLPGLPMTGSFDTAFHADLPDHARRYALPWELTEEHRLWRFGFHGLAHRYMAERAVSLLGRTDATLVTLQLGNGCSAAAVRGLRSVDTSMGLTPLEGLMMGTRSGDVDPGLVVVLGERAGMSTAEALAVLNGSSGLLGVSGLTSDMRELLLAEEAGDRRAALAIEMFCYRVRKQIGAYLAVLGGADAVLFGGGIGERSADVRRRICGGMEWCGLVIDEARNADPGRTERCLTAEGSQPAAWVVPVNEELLIARESLECLAADGARTARPSSGRSGGDGGGT